VGGEDGGADTGADADTDAGADTDTDAGAGADTDAGAGSVPDAGAVTGSEASADHTQADPGGGAGSSKSFPLRPPHMPGTGRGQAERGAHLGGDHPLQRLGHRAAVGEAHLGLLRVDVHVDQLRRQIEEHGADGVAARLEHAPVREGDRAGERAIAHVAAVHEDP
jgi:hypothetical protein